MKRMKAMLSEFFHRDKTPAQVVVSPHITEARQRNVSAAENLHATLGELLDESSRLAFRPVYIVGSDGKKK